MSKPRFWIPEPVTPATRIYRLCRRCGQDVRSSTGKQRLCRDCYEVQACMNRDRAAELSAAGYDAGEIAAELGVRRGTVNEWLRRSRRTAAKGAPVEACPECRFHSGSACSYHRQLVSA